MRTADIEFGRHCIKVSFIGELEPEVKCKSRKKNRNNETDHQVNPGRFISHCIDIMIPVGHYEACGLALIAVVSGLELG